MTKATNPIPIIVSVESGPCAGREVEVFARQLIIGRDAECGLPLEDDATVSRQHASLSWESGTWVLRDLGSKNGTALLGAADSIPIAAAQPVEPGQLILVGSARLLLRVVKSEVTFETEQLRISLQNNELYYEIGSGAAAVETMQQPYREDEIHKARQALHSELGRLAVTPFENAGGRFDACCERLTGLLLPEALADRLLARQGTPLVLLLDPELLDLPWEMLLPHSGYLCMARPLCRQVLLGQAVRGVGARGTRCLVVANPTNDLRQAHEEAEHLLYQLTHEFGIGTVTYIAGGRATLGRVAEELERHDAVIYMGHATHDSDDSRQSGWRLADGVLTFERFNTLRSVPSLVIASACESARTTALPRTKSFSENSAGPAAALLIAGVEQFIGTLWPVPVVSGTTIGAVTLGGIFAGKRAADAVRHARLDARDRLGAAPFEYGGFVQYGRPGWKLNR